MCVLFQVGEVAILKSSKVKHKSKSFHPIFIKLGEQVGGHNISTKFYNQPNPPRHSWIMALELSNIVQN